MHLFPAKMKFEEFCNNKKAVVLKVIIVKSGVLILARFTYYRIAINCILIYGFRSFSIVIIDYVRLRINNKSPLTRNPFVHGLELFMYFRINMFYFSEASFWSVAFGIN